MHPCLRHRGVLAALIGLGVFCSVLTAFAQDKFLAKSSFGPGSQLVDINMGYGKWLEANAPGGSFGFGVGYQYFLTSVASVGFDITADQLGEVKRADGSDPFDMEVVSFLTQVTFHARGRSLIPYVGVGAGPYLFHTTTAREESSLNSRWGVMGRTGLRIVAIRPVIGLDARYSWVFLDPSDTESSFTPGETSAQFLSVKMTLAWMF